MIWLWQRRGDGNKDDVNLQSSLTLSVLPAIVFPSPRTERDAQKGRGRAQCWAENTLTSKWNNAQSPSMWGVHLRSGYFSHDPFLFILHIAHNEMLPSSELLRTKPLCFAFTVLPWLQTGKQLFFQWTHNEDDFIFSWYHWIDWQIWKISKKSQTRNIILH